MRAIIIIGLTVLSCLSTGSTLAAQETQVGPTPEQQLLQRVYQMRMRIEQERAQNENAARANVRLITQSGRGVRQGIDSPTVSSLRQQTSQQLARFESQFQCLDVEVEANSGNTVVICGDNTGDISGTNVSAERDIVTINGGAP